MGTMTTNTGPAPGNVLLERLYDERRAQVDFVDRTIAGANVDGQTRDLSQSERESLERARTRITELDEQIAAGRAGAPL